MVKPGRRKRPHSTPHLSRPYECDDLPQIPTVESSGALPGVMYFHGGGWILGDKETHDRLVREIATGAQATVVFVEYARSPEARYPVAIEQAYTATTWVAEHGASIGVDPSRLAVAGEGVGGNMAAVTTLLAKERGGPQIDFQVLCYPVTDANLDRKEIHETVISAMGSRSR